jgi:Zn ribbon nucleic-acid-binding protein
MERALEHRRNDAGPVRVRAAGWTAQCPQCEAHDFHAPDRLQFLTCVSCGTQTREAELLQQIARNARLLADVLAERSN